MIISFVFFYLFFFFFFLFFLFFFCFFFLFFFFFSFLSSLKQQELRYVSAYQAVQAPSRPGTTALAADAPYKGSAYRWHSHCLAVKTLAKSTLIDTRSPCRKGCRWVCQNWIYGN